MRESNSKLKVQNPKLLFGFSLIEIIVVMALIAIFASMVALVNIPRNLAKGRDNKRQSDIEYMRSALEQYRYDNSRYIISASGGNAATSLVPLPTGGYITSLPTDPTSGNNYFYISSATGTTYNLCGYLETISVTPTPYACASGALCGTGVVCNYQVANP